MNEIIIKNLTKYYGKFKAVNNISLEIDKGKIIGFVGKNGAGKSTVIRCIMNMISPSHGSIKINKLDSIIDSKDVKKVVSYIPSEASFYENITCNKLFKFAVQFTDSKMDEVIKLAKYFELDINKKINELSLGNRKKVSLILGFIKEADIMILDEPTSGLDPLMQNKFFNYILKEKAKGKTIFLSSHNLVEIEKYCDKVAVIKNGEIVDYFEMKEANYSKKQIINYITKDKKEGTIEVTDINEAIKELASLNLESIDIKSSSVENEFSKYYEEEI